MSFHWTHGWNGIPVTGILSYTAVCSMVWYPSYRDYLIYSRVFNEIWIISYATVCSMKCHPSYRDYLIYSRVFIEIWILSYTTVCSIKWYPSNRHFLIYSRVFNEMVSQLPGFSDIQPCVQWNGIPITGILRYTSMCSMKWYPSNRDSLIYSRVFNEMVSQLPGFSHIQPCVQWNGIPVTRILSCTAVCSMKWHPSYREFLIYSRVFNEMVSLLPGFSHIQSCVQWNGIPVTGIFSYTDVRSMKWYPSYRDNLIYSRVFNEMASMLPGFSDIQPCIQWHCFPVIRILSYAAVCSMKWYSSYRDYLIYSCVFKEMASQVPGFSDIHTCVQWNGIPVTGILSYTAVCSMKRHPSYSHIQPCVQWNGIPVTGILSYIAVCSMKWDPSYRDSLIYSRVFNEMASQLPGFSFIQPGVQWNGIPVTGILSYTAVCSMKWYPSYRDSLIYTRVFNETASQLPGILLYIRVPQLPGLHTVVCSMKWYSCYRDNLIQPCFQWNGIPVTGILWYTAVCWMKWYPNYRDSLIYSRVFNEMVSQLPGFSPIQPCVQWNGIPVTGILWSTAVCSMKWYSSCRDSLIYSRVFNEMVSQLLGFSHIQPRVQWNGIPVTGILSYSAVCSMKLYPSYRDSLIYRRVFNEMVFQLPGFSHIQPCVQWNGIPVTGIFSYTDVRSMKWYPSYRDNLIYSRVFNEMASMLPGFSDIQPCIQWHCFPVIRILSYAAVCSMKWYSSYRDYLIYSCVFKEMASRLPGFSDIHTCVQWNGIPVTGILSYTAVCSMKRHPSYSHIQPCVQWNGIPVTGILSYIAVCSMKWDPSYRDSLIYSRVFNEMASQLPGFSFIQPCVQWNGIPVTGILSYTAVCSMKWYPSYRDSLIYTRVFNETASQLPGILLYIRVFSEVVPQLPGLHTVVCSMKWYSCYRDNLIQPCFQWNGIPVTGILWYTAVCWMKWYPNYRDSLIYSRVFNEMVSQLPGFSPIQPCVQWNGIPVTGILWSTAVCSMKWYSSCRDSLIYSRVFNEMVSQLLGFSHIQPRVQWNGIPVTGILSYSAVCSMKLYPSYRDSLIYGRVFNEMVSQLPGFFHIQPCVQWNGIPVTGILWYTAVFSMKWHPSYRDFLIYSRMLNEMVSQLPGFSDIHPCVQRNGIPVTRILSYTVVCSMKWYPCYRDSLIYSRAFNEMVSPLTGFSNIQPCVQWNGIPVTGILSYRAVCSMKWYPSYRDSLIYSSVFNEMVSQLPGFSNVQPCVQWYGIPVTGIICSRLFNEMVSQLPGFSDIQQCFQWNGIPITGIL